VNALSCTARRLLSSKSAQQGTQQAQCARLEFRHASLQLLVLHRALHLLHLPLHLWPLHRLLHRLEPLPHLAAQCSSEPCQQRLSGGCQVAASATISDVQLLCTLRLKQLCAPPGPSWPPQGPLGWVPQLLYSAPASWALRSGSARRRRAREAAARWAAPHTARYGCALGMKLLQAFQAVPSYRFHPGRARTSKQVEVSRSGFEWDKLKHLNIRNSGDMHSVPPFLTLESKRSLAILLAHGCPLLSASCLCTSPPTASEQHLSHAALAVRSRHQRAAAYYKHTAARGCRRLSLVAAGERACCVHATML